MTHILPNKEKLLRNFAMCDNWEEKYLYLIELGHNLSDLPNGMRNEQYLISGCQSQVWIVMIVDQNSRYVKFYGDSDSLIVRGLIAIVFVLYQKLTPEEITKLDVRPFFNKLTLNKHLTPSRSQGLEAIVRSIRTQAQAEM